MKPIHHFSPILPYFLLAILKNVKILDSFLLDEYPNPMRNDQFTRCNMPTTSYLCDPEGILTISERSELARFLNSFQDQTKNDAGESGCKKKGVTAAVALSRKPLYSRVIAMGKELNNTQNAPFQLLQNWNLDNECRKAFVFALPVDAIEFGRISFYFATPIVRDELNHLFAAEHSILQQKRWVEAIRGILVGIRQIINDRHGMLSGKGDSDGEENGGDNVSKFQFSESRSIIKTTRFVAPSVWTHFLLSICTVFASVLLTLAILWAFRRPIVASMRHGLPLIRFNNNTHQPE